MSNTYPLKQTTSLFVLVGYVLLIFSFICMFCRSLFVLVGFVLLIFSFICMFCRSLFVFSGVRVTHLLSVNRRKIDNTMDKRKKDKRTNNDLQNIHIKLKMSNTNPTKTNNDLQNKSDILNSIAYHLPIINRLRRYCRVKIETVNSSTMNRSQALFTTIFIWFI
jgi:hypothetical protein